MAEKMFELKHRISESKLLALISAHAEEVSVDIYVPERKTRQPRLTNGRDQPQFLLEAPTKTQAHQARGPYKKDGALGTSALMLQILNQNRKRAVSMKEIIAHAAPHNVSAGAVSVAASKLLKEQAIERVGIGQYKILKEGIARAPKEAGEEPSAESEPAAPKTKSPGVGRGNYPRGDAAGGGRKLIWAELVKGEPVHSAPFRTKYTELGLSPSSVSGAFDSFIHRGLVMRIEEGVFQITEKGKEHHAAKN